MRLINKTTGVVLAERVIFCTSIATRMKGLLGRQQFCPKEALVIKPGNSIHTFFMKFAIDVIFLGKDNRIIKACSAIPPFRITPIYWKSSLVIELPSGVLAQTSTGLGDTIVFE